MGKRQDWFFVSTCFFLLLSLITQIHCTNQRSLRGGLTSISNVNQQSLKDKDLIQILPGQPGPVSFRQYGGYVTVDETAGRFFYYYFVEAIKANDSTPLVIWLNGGPGCSSLGGALLEHGPFRVHSDGKTLFENPYSWNNEANMLYLESPATVGFSYTNTPLSDDYLGDKMATEDNYMFLVKWLERFPEYKGREFYITGQSYAGHYVPKLAQMILQRNNQTFINLRGIFIGNPSLDSMVELERNNQFLFEHAVISQDLYEQYVKYCVVTPDWKNEYGWKCMTIEDKIDDLSGKLDLYNIHKPLCLDPTLTSKPKTCTTITKVDPCSSNYIKPYLNNEQVQEAMHANTTKLQYPWLQCNPTLLLVWNSNDTQAPMVPILDELMRNNLRIWVYSGDLDAMVSVTATMSTLKKMNLTVEKTWRPWFSEGEVGGFTEDYKGNFKFATVKAAGHSVPSDQPIRALTLFTSFIRNTPLLNTL